MQVWPSMSSSTRAARISRASRLGRTARWSAVLALLGSVLLACDGGGGGEGGGDGEMTELVVAVGETDGYDWKPELDNEKSSLTFGDTLIMMNPETFELEPGLAESWELSPDGRTWTFRLRPDVEFHDDWGTVTSEDVKFTYGRWVQEDSDHGSRTVQMRAAIDDDMDNFEIVDDLTFKLHTTTPVVHLASVLSYAGAGMTVTSKRYFDETDPEIANTHPIGTGPWEFVSSEPGQELVLDAVETPHPYRSTPQYDRLILRYIPDGAARLAQLQSGAVGIAQLQSDLSGEAEAAGLQLVSIKSVGHADVILGGMYFGDPHLDEDAPWVQGDNPDSSAGKAIREAMSLAIDRELILDRVLAGDGQLTVGPLMVYNESDALTDASWSLPEYNLEKAKEKLAEGGYPDGFPIEFLLYDQDVDTSGVGEAIAGMWEELGLDVQRSPIEEEINDEYLRTYNSDGHAWIHMQAANTEPAPQLQTYYPDPTYGDYKWFHPATTEAFEEISVEPDLDTRFEIVTTALGELRDDYVPINLFSVDLPYALSDDVESWTPDPVLNTVSRLEDVVPASD